MMSRGRWRIWSVCRRGWRGGGIISRRVRGGRNCWGKGWRRFGGFVKGSVEVSSGFSFDPVVVSFATANDNPPCRDEAAPRVGHPELWRSRVGHPALWRGCIVSRIMKASKIAAVVGVVVVCVGAGAQSLLVANQGDATLSVIDAASGKQVATIEEKTPGVHGHEVVASADGRVAYLPIYGSTGVGKPGVDGHEMLVIDVPTHAVVGRVEFGHGVRPHLPVLDAKRHLLYVTTELDDAVTVIDTRTRKIVGKVPTGA